MIRTSKPFLLSDKGSNRATAYVFSNKAVTLAGKTHVVWTDDVAVTRGRTYDHAANRWGTAFTIGEGRDNHNTPCLIADEEGRLQIAFGPHGMWDSIHEVCEWPTGCFRYGVSDKPGVLRSIKSLKPFGYNATYAVLARTLDKRTAIVYRGGDYPLCVQFQIQRPNGGWFTAQPLFAQDIAPQYTFYGAHMTAAKDGALYVIAHFYNAGAKTSAGVALLKTPDLGKTWLDIRNRKAVTPQYLNPRIAVPHMGPEEGPYNGGVAVAPDGAVWCLVHPTLAGRYRPLLSRWGGKAWHTIDLSAFLPPERGFWRGFLSIDARGRIHVLGCALLREQLKPGENTFGHPSSQIYYLCSTDNGRTFDCRQLSDGDPDSPSWMPSLSQPGLFHPVDNPVLLFTKGRNPPARVYCVRVLGD
jgi:hypothetical protein